MAIGTVKYGELYLHGMDLLYFSGPNDHVFVNFADHGAPGIVAFPADEVRCVANYTCSLHVTVDVYIK